MTWQPCRFSLYRAGFSGYSQVKHRPQTGIQYGKQTVPVTCTCGLLNTRLLHAHLLNIARTTHLLLEGIWNRQVNVIDESKMGFTFYAIYYLWLVCTPVREWSWWGNPYCVHALVRRKTTVMWGTFLFGNFMFPNSVSFKLINFEF